MSESPDGHARFREGIRSELGRLFELVFQTMENFMTRIAWIATLLGTVLLATGCTPAPQPPPNPPPVLEPALPEPIAEEPEEPAEPEKPKVVDAVGNALFKSLLGDEEEEELPEAPPFNPQP